MVDQNNASRNPLISWLRDIEALQRAASHRVQAVGWMRSSRVITRKRHATGAEFSTCSREIISARLAMIVATQVSIETFTVTFQLRRVFIGRGRRKTSAIEGEFDTSVSTRGPCSCGFLEGPPKNWIGAMPYSLRRATIGSTLAARRAGK
jgi:hypothetical protein